MSKLTLSVDSSVVEGAKRYAREHGVSVSRLVQTYLSALATPESPASEPPVLRGLRGTLRRVSVADYRRHLAAKYR